MMHSAWHHPALVPFHPFFWVKQTRICLLLKPFLNQKPRNLPSESQIQRIQNFVCCYQRSSAVKTAAAHRGSEHALILKPCTIHVWMFQLCFNKSSHFPPILHFLLASPSFAHLVVWRRARQRQVSSGVSGTGLWMIISKAVPDTHMAISSVNMVSNIT